MIRTVLVIDDAQTDRANLEKILSDAQYVVSSSTSGALGVEKAKQDKPDAIFMDVNMPDMDGFAAVRALRNDAATKDIPVIFVTAKDQKADKAWGQMLGAKGYITKPYSKEQILDQLRTL